MACLRVCCQVALPVAVVAVMSTETASATTYLSSGQACQVQSGGDLSSGAFIDYGATNASSSTAIWYSCPITAYPSSTMALTSAGAFFIDQSSVSSVYGYVAAASPSGTYYSAFKYSCSTAGGCSSATTSYQGEGYLSWVNPFGTAAVTAYSWSLLLSVPAVRTGSYYSDIESYWAQI
jgi:hypothetical protein